MRLPEHASDERRAVLLETAAYVAKTVATILDPDQLLQRTVDIICDAFGFYYAGVFLSDHDGEWAELRAGYGDAGRTMVAEGHKLKIGGNSMIGASIEKRHARIALDVGEEAVHFHNPHLPETRSEMALPLIVGDEAVGALTVQSEEEAAFTREDIDTLQAMADQLAIAIKNARLHRQNRDLLRRAERRTRLLQAAHEVGKKLTSILDLGTLLPKTVDIICDAYGFYYAGVFLLDETGEWAVLRAGHGPAGEAMIAEGHKLRAGGHSMIGASVYLREARIALDVGEEAVHFKNPHLPYTRSEMALPLIVGDIVLGAVTVQSVEERAFDHNDIVMLQTMADQLAIAIRNAQLLNEIQRAHTKLLRTKTYEALATATTEAVHWIGNKALPITTTIARAQDDLRSGEIDLDSLQEDLELVGESARQIVEVKENLLGSIRDQRPRGVMVDDLWQVAAHRRQVPAEIFDVEIDPATPLVLADSMQLVRAFGNLLQNALEAGAGQIRVQISPADEDGFVRMRLSDDGHGIPADIRDKIWATFFTTRGTEHQGMGLAACLHIITQLDGRIGVESQPDRGTAFTIVLPVYPDAVPPADFGAAPRSILLVDDDDAWSRFFVDTLVGAGKKVVLSDSPKGIIDADLVLVDESIQAVPLAEVLESLQVAGIADRVVLVSPARDVESVTAHMQTGIRDMAQKPYTPRELADLLLA